MGDLAEVHVLGGGGPQSYWTIGGSFKFPSEILEEPRSAAGAIMLESRMRGGCSLGPAATPEQRIRIVKELRERRMFTETPPASSRLPFSYQLIPSFMRTAAASIIGWQKRRYQRVWADFPAFPLDLSTDALADLLEVPHHPFRPTPVALTHDIDSPEGLANLSLFLDEEEAVGARSTNFVVPHSWRIDHGMLSEVQQRGHEIGVHGYDHSNTTPFMDEAGIRKRFDQLKGFIGQYRVRGYRAPSLLRTRALLKALSHYFEYDSSIPTSGGLFPVPNNGCASARPFMAEGITEVPLSLPRDGSLLFLGYRPKAIREVWLASSEYIRRAGGIVVLLTHCERRFSGRVEMREQYRQVLRFFAANDRYRFMTCGEVAAYRASVSPS